MRVTGYKSIRAPRVLSHIKDEWAASSHQSPHFHTIIKDSLPYAESQPPPPAPSSPNSNSRISPAVLFIIVILAVIFFISGLLHLLVRFLIRKHPSSTSSPHANRRQAAEISSSDALQRQLQQLFHLHDTGLDQAFIDALPVFLYMEIVGSKEPFDCAVCLCEFAPEDKLRLLPLCGHAFHLNCIDTWLLSNSTCPLCRGALFVQGVTIENPIFDFEDFSEEDGYPIEMDTEGDEVVREKRVYPVRLGKFKNLGNSNGNDSITADDSSGMTVSDVRREEGESSSSNLDARRCFSMGSCQYVVADTNLQVALSGSIRNTDSKVIRGKRTNGQFTSNEVMEGNRLSLANKGESFSVSKIWQWSNKKGKFPVSSDISSLDRSSPWIKRSSEDIHEPK